MGIIFNILATAAAALIAAYIIPGVTIADVKTALLVALVLALLNTFVKPILVVLTIPVTIVTLGLFLLVINILIIKWTASIVDGFNVEGWFAALLFSLVVSVVNSIFTGLAKKSEA
ncbi:MULTISPECIES: phage holin family protein [Chitinophagaceae]|uniref:phage holin family protein n=1 Tax=Chitinophagaceae TaxID=563835 RepID=UPI000DEFC1DC|nr:MULTISPECIES: phage holin family protein [Chitinophagaceae]RPD50987.1 phage holin family protein [Paracnuella aquatica]